LGTAEAADRRASRGFSVPPQIGGLIEIGARRKRAPIQSASRGDTNNAANMVHP
jgi:hypothetical protein